MRLGSRSTAQANGGGVGTVHQMPRADGGIMIAVPTNVGVFFGQVDKRAEGWYWADAQSEKLRGAIRGPFETKELAVKDALRAFGKPQVMSHKKEARRDQLGGRD
jgi:hypothetical protein